MEKILSQCQPGLLLHMVHRKSEMTEVRTDLVDSGHFIQCSALNLSQGQTFKPHQHVWKPGPDKVIAQESWVVISGRVRCLFFDTNGQLLAERELNPGDASFTLQGGHNYVALEENTLVYEYKTGPYQGQQLDKVFLND
jgi:cupin fold WbuC family metalloprotein